MTQYKDFPPGKKVGVTLLWGIVEGNFERTYIVKAISNTTYYKPGDKLSAAEVQILCNMPDCEVSMVGEDIIAAITNTVGAATAIKSVPGLL